MAASVASAVVGGVLLAVNVPAVAEAAPGATTTPTTRPWQTLTTADGARSAPAATGATPWAVARDGEVPELRTRMTRTYAGTDGRFRTVSSPVPVNVKDAQGRWTPIDDTLVRGVSGTYGVTADAYSLAVPPTAADPVTAGTGSLSVRMRLAGAAAAPVRVAGSTATYRDVLPGVDHLVWARPGSVDQALRLASAKAPSSYRYDVTLPAGASLRPEADRSLSIVDNGGKVVGSLPPPLMRDSSGDLDTETSSNVHYEVAGPAVTVVADATWLADPARVFPVLIDPSVTFGTSDDFGCYVSSPGASDGSVCAGNSGTDNTLNYGHTGYIRHLLLKFGDLTGAGSAVPADAVVSDAALTLTEKNDVNGTAIDTGVYRVGAPFTTSVTWANQPGLGSIQDHVSVTPPGAGGTVTFHVANLVNSWIKGGNPNYGLEIRQPDDSVGANSIAFYGMANANHPTLTVTWQPAVGQQKWIGAYDHKLSDRLDLHVGLASRNLVLNATDLSLSAPGQSLVVRRTYNSRTAAATTGAFGVGWLMSGGTDVTVAVNRGGVTLTQPGGAQTLFYRNFATDDLTDPAAFNPPPGINADLTKPDATHYRLTFHASKLQQTFTLPSAGASTGWLSSVKDADGNTTTYTATGSPLQTTKATDTTGQRWVSFTYTSGRVTGMAESLATAPRSWSYGYDGTGHLTSSTDPAGKTARYCYTGALLTRVVTPLGNAAGSTCTAPLNAQTTDIAYDAAGRVNSITYRSAAATPIVVQFATVDVLPIASSSGTGRTRITDPYLKDTFYTYDTRDRVTKTVDPLGNERSSTYTTNNDVSTATSPNNTSTGGPATTYEYDNNTNPTKATLPGSGSPASVSASYGGSQTYLPDTTTDDLGKVSSHSYNTAGHLTATTKGTVKVENIYEGTVHCGPGGAAAYGGALCEVRDGDFAPATSITEHRTRYNYNALGEMVTLTPAAPNHGRATPAATTVTYDSHSRPRTVTDGKGQATTYTYDPLDRLTRIDYAGGTYTVIGYDEDGDQKSRTDYTASGTVVAQDVSTYDALDRLATYTNAGTGLQTLTWDANSRLTGYTDGGGTVTYGYDTAGGLTSVAEPGGTCAGYSPTNLPPASALCTIIQLDRNGARQRVVHPGGKSEIDTTYDSAGRPTEIDDKAQVSGVLASVVDYTYSYVTAGKDTVHVAKRTDKLDANTTQNYAYSAEGWLTSATGKNSGGTTLAQLTWCYDANGNRTHATVTVGWTCPGTATSSYDGANQQLTSNYGSTGYSYDLTGAELTAPTGATGSTQTRTSTYTPRQQVDTIKPSASGPVLPQTYLGAGNDERLTTGVSSTAVDRTVNGPLGIMSYTRVTSGTPGTTTYVTRDPQGGLLGLRVGSARYYVQSDNRGSLLKLVDSAGGVVLSRAYDPYGAWIAASGTLVVPFGFTGAYTDGTTGLVKLGARYYDPALGRFTQTDPESHPGDTSQASPYPYAGNDPVNNTDPTGRSLFSDIGTVFTAGGTGTGTGLFAGAVVGATIGGIAGCALGAVAAGPAGCFYGAAELGIAGGTYGAEFGTVIGGEIGAFYGINKVLED